jgi:hypothetical protein
LLCNPFGLNKAVLFYNLSTWKLVPVPFTPEPFFAPSALNLGVQPMYSLHVAQLTGALGKTQTDYSIIINFR